jgi:transposase
VQAGVFLRNSNSILRVKSGFSPSMSTSRTYKNEDREHVSKLMTTNDSAISSEVYLGIDVSKGTLDVCLLRMSGKPLFRQFTNTPLGHAQLIEWARKQGSHAVRRFCMEATGSYSEAPAIALHEAGEYTSVVNPATIKYSGPDGAANKTDKAASLKIAQFARMHLPQAWEPPAPEIRELTALVRHLDDLIAEQARIKTRLAAPGIVAPVMTSLTALLNAIAEQIKNVSKLIDEHVNNHPDLKRNRALLETIPGIGRATAERLLAEIPVPFDKFTAQSLAAFFGVSPKQHRSGSSVFHPTKISKAGRKSVRSALYWPAISAITHNPRVRELAERLRAAGKHSMAIIVAAMRKLIMLAYGVLKSGKPFTPVMEH